jgi:hypothetical protein
MVACFVNRGRAFFAQSFLAGQEGLLRIRKTPKPDWKNQKYLRQEAALLTTGASNAFSRRCTLISDLAPPPSELLILGLIRKGRQGSIVHVLLPKLAVLLVFIKKYRRILVILMQVIRNASGSFRCWLNQL